jgi:hypothetical protein
MPTEGRCQIDNSIFLTADVPSTTLTRRLAAGEVVRLGTGLYPQTQLPILSLPSSGNGWRSSDGCFPGSHHGPVSTHSWTC